MLLQVERLEASYGSSQVLFGVEMNIREGEVVSILGRNGMGKTTTVRNITGMMRPTAGRISFLGRSTASIPTYQIARLGIGLVPEGRQIFPTLTVRENLVATAAKSGGRHAWTVERVEALFPILRERTRQKAALLSGGQQQMLAIGRALMTNPRLLILDEATEGLAPLIRQDVWNSLRILKESELAILVIDKNLAELKRVADRHYIMNKGRIVWEGGNSDLDSQPETVDRYLHI